LYKGISAYLSYMYVYIYRPIPYDLIEI
jgi:hypothetical protein